MAIASSLSGTGSPALERVYAHLRERIISGRYEGGMRLKQEEIAAELRVSRIPVRDAIQRLQVEGLVTLQPDRGVRVTQLTPDDIREVFEIRAALEELGVRLAMERLDSRFLREAEDLLRRLDSVRDDPALWLRRHEELHEHLVQSDGRPRLAAQIRQYRQMVEPYFRLYMGAYRDPEMPDAEHHRLLDVIKAGQPDAAAAAMRHHAMAAAANVIAFLKATRPSDVA